MVFPEITAPQKRVSMQICNECIVMEFTGSCGCWVRARNENNVSLPIDIWQCDKMEYAQGQENKTESTYR